jgi:hypothetical protein
MRKGMSVIGLAAAALLGSSVPTTATANAADTDCPTNWVCGWNTQHESGAPAWRFDTAIFENPDILAWSLMVLFGDSAHTFHTTSTFNRSNATWCLYSGGDEPAVKTNVLGPHTGGNLANTVTNWIGRC